VRLARQAKHSGDSHVFLFALCFCLKGDNVQEDPKASFGIEQLFHAGLDTLGMLPPKILQAMQKEFLDALDSKVSFTAWNSSHKVTKPEVEWKFVIDPFVKESASKSKSSKDWTTRHEYGGNGFPIQLTVSLHAVSVTA